jgi:hypothetical protein
MSNLLIFLFVTLHGLFGWGGFRLMDLDLRAQIKILCLDDLKSLGFGFWSNPSRILKAQIHGFQMTSVGRNFTNLLIGCQHSK